MAECREAIALTLGFNLSKVETQKKQGTILLMARIARRKSREELAEQIGVTRRCVYHWEMGDRKLSEDNIERLEILLQQSRNLICSSELPQFNLIDSNPYKRQGVILWMARVGQQLSRDELSEHLGTCRESLRLMETGKRAIDAIMLNRVALVLRQDVKLFWS